MTETMTGPGDGVRGEEREVERFDFLQPRRVSPAALKTLQLVHEGFAESLGAMLSSRLQTVVTAGGISVEQRFYHECLASLSGGSCVHVFRMASPAGSGALVMSARLALALVARLLGGATLSATADRPLTRIEQRVLGVVIERVLAELSTTWKSIGGFSANADRFENEPEFIQIAGRGEIVLTVSLELASGDQRHPVQFWLPVNPLEEVLARLAPPSAPRSGENGTSPWMDAVRRRLEGIPVPVRCVLGDSLITLRELLNLGPGDILRTGVSIDDELQIQIGDRARFRGRPGIANSKVALRITHIEPHAEQGA
jgi:flagellar motor switch protein FliM